jgi:hypothetical protein
MYKKLIIPVILALVATMAFSNVAFAASSAIEGYSYGRQVGTIINVDTAASTIKLANNKGQKVTIHLDANNLYRGKASSQTDLATGMYINVKTKQLTGGVLLAASVNALKTQVTSKIIGVITAKHASSVTIKASDGNTYTYEITSRTTFSGHGVTNFAGLSVGMKIKVTYTDLSDGVLRATSVVVQRTK